MKTWPEVLNRLRTELDQWFMKQCRNIHADYYLYYQATTPERNGGFLFLEDKPENTDYLLGWNQPANKGATVEQNMHTFSDILRRLPIMSIA